jgi:hypothetical protein
MTTWRSIINSGPSEEEDGYSEWLEEVLLEPWVQALWGLVQWSGVWTGTEDQLIQQMRMRVAREVRASEDFPSSLEQLTTYMDWAIDGILSSGLGVFDYHQELADGDLDDFDVPGWGPEAPILVKAGDACYRPYYRDAQFELLKFWHPVPVAIVHLTASREFAKSRKRSYSTQDLAKVLGKYYPSYRNVPGIALASARPEGVDDAFPEFSSDEEFEAMVNLYGPKPHLLFSKQMRKWAPS